MPGSATDRLLAVTRGLGRPRIFERSVKIGAGGISADRGLVSLPPVQWETLVQCCADLGAPRTPDFAHLLSRACAVHFGADGDIGKCYLEFRPATAPEPGLVFLAAKWQGEEMALNPYTVLSGLDHGAKRAEVAASVPGLDAGPLLDHARAGDPDDEAVVLKVTEEGTERLSWDISVADSGYSVEQSRPIVDRFLAGLGSNWEALTRALPEDAPASLLGHVALGQDRAGAPFVTLYYGARTA